MLFRASASVVTGQALAGSLYLHLTDNFVHAYNRKPSPSEVRSWERSIPRLVQELNDAGLGQVEVLLEYGLPLTSKRADAVLAGVHPETGEPSYVVVELKQWSSAEPDDEDARMCRVADDRRTSRLNPIEQVRGYCDYLAQFNGALHAHPERLAGVAYLHNATDFGVNGLFGHEQSQYGRLFTADRQGMFRDFLRSRLAAAEGTHAADQLCGAKVGPSRRLIAVAAEEVRQREQFVLLDEQRVAYEKVLRAVRRSREGNHKAVVVITGGPGTGKSVIALSLLGELYRQGRKALHATGSQSFTTTMRKVAGARKPEVQDLFKYFNSFISARPNDLEVLICDEAHRMRETSANRFTRAEHRTGRRQIDELLDAAAVPVFLLDEHQVVRPGELGTVDEIEEAAAKRGIECTVVSLDSQFRCGGSAAYLNWVHRLLGLQSGRPGVWEPDGRMSVELADSPEELESRLEAKRDQGYSARMTAGYCWRWTKKVQAGQALPADVVIGDWARPWNVYGSRSVNGAPPAALWATDPAGFSQVGCVYTAQGFEYDWNGVIIGPDLVWRSDRWVVDRASSKDPVFKKATTDEVVDKLIRNTYKVLLTRGMIGTVLYSTDAETRKKLREMVVSEGPLTARAAMS